MTGKEWDWKKDHRHKNIDPLDCPNRIRLLRFERGWSSGDLANKIGSIRGTVLDYERGRLHPGSNILSRLCETFDVEVGDIFWRKGEREEMIRQRQTEAPRESEEDAESEGSATGKEMRNE